MLASWAERGLAPESGPARPSHCLWPEPPLPMRPPHLHRPTRLLRPGIARWLPFAGLCALLLLLGASGSLLLTLRSALLLALLLPCWLLVRRQMALAGIALLLVTPLGWPVARDALWSAPTLRTLRTLPAETPLRVEGTLRQRWQLPAAGSERAQVRVLLGEATVWTDGGPLPFGELLLDLPASSTWPFRSRRTLAVGGRLRAVTSQDGRPLLHVTDARFHFRAAPLAVNGSETLRLRLRDRAAYHLHNPALAVYLPVLLGLRERSTPEAREVVQAFRDLGVAHLFAISGLHVGLLYLCFLTVLWAGLRLVVRVQSRRGQGRSVLGRLGLGRWGQGSVQGPRVVRLLAMALVWAYIALIGFPLPALRAALMGSMLLWSGLWGTRTPRLYILALAALLLLAPAPTQLHDLSFQLSFLAYLFLIAGLELWPRWPLLRQTDVLTRWQRKLLGLADVAGLSLWVTLWVTVGLLPVVAEAFGRVSLLVFLGNLLMIPLLTYLVLPLGLLALLVSLARLGTGPALSGSGGWNSGLSQSLGAWLEGLVFGAVDQVFGAWAAIAGALAQRGAGWVLDLPGGWAPRIHALYYLSAAVVLAWAFLRKRRGTPWRDF